VVEVVVLDVERIREVEVVDPETVVSVSVAARAHASLRFWKILYSIVIYSTETHDRIYSLSRILFESLVSIRFINSEIVPAEIATAENSSRTAPAIAQPMCMTPIPHFSTKTHPRIPIPVIARRPAVSESKNAGL